MDKKKSLGILGMALLFGAAIAWGTSFLVLKNTIEGLPTLYVLGIRFFFSAIIIALICFKKTIKIKKGTALRGAAIGVVVFCAYLTQTYGLRYTTPGQNAFITAMYCVMTPFLVWFIYKVKPKSYNVAAAVTCVVGIGLVALSGSEENSSAVFLGNCLTFASAIFYALQVVFIDRFAKEENPLQLLICELFVIGALFLILSAAIEIPVYGISSFAIKGSQLFNIVYLTLVCTLFAQFAQLVGQKFTTASQSAVILSLEGVFGTLFSVLMGAESLTLTMGLGFAAIFAATLVSELKPDIGKFIRKKPSENSIVKENITKHKREKNMFYTIDNGRLKLTVSSMGAEPISLTKDGKERLWQNDNGEWDGHAPILFPVCGSCYITVEGKKYPFAQHGFAPLSEFTLKEKTDNSLVLTLSSSEETKKRYPYDFVFTVTYSIEDSSLKIGYEVENPSVKDIYFSCGSHESFALDGELEEYVVNFEKEERFINHLHDDDGFLTGETQNLGEGCIIDFGKNPLVNDKTFIFKDVRSRKVTLVKKDGTPVVDVFFDGFNNLLFWRPGDGKTICIEPWLNLPDEKDSEKELSDKYGVRHLKPNEKASFLRKIVYR